MKGQNVNIPHLDEIPKHLEIRVRYSNINEDSWWETDYKNGNNNTYI
jgi:hypothetical protein